VIDLTIDVTLSQGDFVLEVRESSSVEVLGLFGPSGGGKTSLLEAVAGLRRPASGHIAVSGRVLYDAAQGIDLAPQARRIGYVPQDALLFPHLDVRANVLYGTKKGTVPFSPKVQIQAQKMRSEEKGTVPFFVDDVVAMLEIGPLLDRRIRYLSGGEKQRVAIARALVTHPALLLLDEPLAAVDRERRDRILPYLLRIRRELHVPLVYVTHDAAELTAIADRVLRLEGGRVVASGPPAVLWPES